MNFLSSSHMLSVTCPTSPIAVLSPPGRTMPSRLRERIWEAVRIWTVEMEGEQERRAVSCSSNAPW
jgi:hypothetical protein